MSDHTYLKWQNQIEVSKDAELHLKIYIITQLVAKILLTSSLSAL